MPNPRSQRTKLDRAKHARPADVCHNLAMLPIEHNDPINAKILAIS
jgi:hypothetical protein